MFNVVILSFIMSRYVLIDQSLWSLWLPYSHSEASRLEHSQVVLPHHDRVVAMDYHIVLDVSESDRKST